MSLHLENVTLGFFFFFLFSAGRLLLDVEKFQQSLASARLLGFSWPQKWQPWLAAVLEMALLYSSRKEYAIHTQQGLGSRKCGSSLPPKWVLKFTCLHCSHSNRKTLLTYSHRKLCKRNCRRKKIIMPGKKFNEVPFFHLFCQLRVTVYAFGNQEGKAISYCSMNLPILHDWFTCFVRHSILWGFFKWRAIKNCETQQCSRTWSTWDCEEW